MKERILAPWDWLRIIRLVIGVSVVFQAIVMQSWLLVAAGVLLSLMALLNMGCGVNGCAPVTRTQEPSRKESEISFEEIKSSHGK
jgi:hypothetical protein